MKSMHFPSFRFLRLPLLLVLLAAGIAQADEPAKAGPAKTTPAAIAAAPKADPTKGQQIASTVCVACHNADGNATITANPRLAGQSAEYLYKQLKAFKSIDGKPPERPSPVMMGMANNLSDDDMHNVAAWFASQGLKPSMAKNKETIEQGKKIYRGGDLAKGLPACAGCHGPTGSGIPAQYPRIGGQNADYLEAQLKSFRDGGRANDPNKMMRLVAIKMTDAEIKAVSDYIAGVR